MATRPLSWSRRIPAEGKLGLDMYGMREPLAKAALAYIDELEGD